MSLVAESCLHLHQHLHHNELIVDCAIFRFLFPVLRLLFFVIYSMAHACFRFLRSIRAKPFSVLRLLDYLADQTHGVKKRETVLR